MRISKFLLFTSKGYKKIIQKMLKRKRGEIKEVLSFVTLIVFLSPTFLCHILCFD